MTLTGRDDPISNRYAIPALQSAIRRNDGILIQEYLNIQGFEDVPISQLDFSARSSNCLMREFGETCSCRTVFEMPLKSLIELKNAGAKTIEDILSCVDDWANERTALRGPFIDSVDSLVSKNHTSKKGVLLALRPFAAQIAEENWDEIEAQLKSDAERAALVRLRESAACIGADMVAAALSDPYPTEVLLPIFQEFVRNQEADKRRRKEIRDLVDQLPEDRKDLPVKPFLMRWPRWSSAVEREPSMGDDLTFRQLAKSSVQVSEKESSALPDFLAWCSFDLEWDVRKVMDRCIKNARTREVLALRAEGKTLAEVGDAVQVSRERIRQIEMKAVKCIRATDAEAILLKISAVCGGAEILTAREIHKCCGIDADLFLHLLRNKQAFGRFRYTKTHDAFILDSEQTEEDQVRTFVDGLPNRFDAEEFSAFLDQATEQGIPSELVELQIRSDYSYHKACLAWQRGRITIREMCREVLPSFDPNGVHVSVPEEIETFRTRIIQRFGRDVRLSEGDRAFTSIIAEIGMLRDRGTYVAVRDHILSDELLQRIRTYVDSGENEVYLFSTLFEVFRAELQQVGVDNRYYLQGILKREWEGRYFFSRDCLSKGKRATSISDTVEAFIQDAGRYVSSAEIKEAFPGITDAVLNLALSKRAIIGCGGKIIHASALPLDDGIVRRLRETVETLVEDGLEHHSRELYHLADRLVRDWMEENGAADHATLFGIAAYLFDDSFVFSRPWIAKKGTLGEAAIRRLRKRGTAAELVDWTPPPVQEGDPGCQVTCAVSAETAAHWNSVLAEDFPDGLRLNGMRLRKFRGICEERFHETIEADDEKLIEQLKSACAFRDDRVYAKQDEAQETLMDVIRGEILDTLTGGASCVYPQQIFERYKAQLGQRLAVYHIDAFLRLLLEPGKCAFRLSGGLLCLPGKLANIFADILGAFQNSHTPLTYPQLAEQLWYIPFDKIKAELAAEPSLIRIDRETYFYAPFFPISIEELAALRSAMRQRIEEEGYIVARDLRELMQLHCPGAEMDTASWKDWAVRDVIGWLLRDAFDFTGIVICAKGAGLGCAQVIRSFCRTHSQFSLDELKDLCARLEVSGIYWNEVTPEAVRISRTEFVSRGNVFFDVEATDAVLDAICTGDYMPLKAFTRYMALPGASFPWNGFLLESYLRDYSRLFRLEQAGPTETAYIGAMVRRESKIRTMRELLVDALAHEDSWTNAKEALSLLSQQGYRSSRILANAAEIVDAAQALRARLKGAEK